VAEFGLRFLLRLHHLTISAVMRALAAHFQWKTR